MEETDLKRSIEIIKPVFNRCNRLKTGLPAKYTGAFSRNAWKMHT